MIYETPEVRGLPVSNRDLEKTVLKQTTARAFLQVSRLRLVTATAELEDSQGWPRLTKPCLSLLKSQSWRAQAPKDLA